MHSNWLKVVSNIVNRESSNTTFIYFEGWCFVFDSYNEKVYLCLLNEKHLKLEPQYYDTVTP